MLLRKYGWLLIVIAFALVIAYAVLPPFKNFVDPMLSAVVVAVGGVPALVAASSIWDAYKAYIAFAAGVTLMFIVYRWHNVIKRNVYRWSNVSQSRDLGLQRGPQLMTTPQSIPVVQQTPVPVAQPQPVTQPAQPTPQPQPEEQQQSSQQ